MEIEKTWSEFKTLVDTKLLIMQYHETDHTYELFALEDGTTYTCQILKDVDTVDVFPSDWQANRDDFESNYKATANTRITGKTEIKEFEKTGGYFRVHGGNFTATANSTTTHDFSFPYDVEVLSGGFFCKGLNDGDEVDFIIAPDTVVGAVTIAGSAGADTIDVSPTVITNMKNGRHVKFGTDTNEYVVYDVLTTQIKISPVLVNAVAPNDLVKMSVKMAEGITVADDARYIEFGLSKIGSSYISKNTIIRIVYKNNHATQDAAVRYTFDLLY